jgi:hypothetical protein
MYALYGYMYAASLLFILRGRCASQAANIGLLGCMHALAGLIVRLLQAWLDCMYVLHSYMYAASLLSMLRCTRACRAACIDFLGCMNALAGFLCVSYRLGLTACTLCMATCMRPVCASFLEAGATPGLHVLATLAA